ncbi:methyltransferase [Bdellovibrio bacteriovorus]|uniref:methyltransferase n=1 Tax=Bdellovibrio bacteriovorus TaxID=959 RepID=UPI0035A744B6
MSSVNPHFTFKYTQPEEYRFSHDSVFLARQVYELYSNKDVKDLTALDLCSGCGIIGLDFLFHCQKNLNAVPKHFDFLEVQSVYEKYFLENVSASGIKNCEMHFLNMNYSELLREKYFEHSDLILCNPPYFFTGNGKLSPSEFKNRCRFYLDSDFKTLLNAIEHSLRPAGNAFVLLRDLQEHGWNSIAEARKILSSSLQITELPDIRGTGVIQIHKPM